MTNASGERRGLGPLGWLLLVLLLMAAGAGAAVWGLAHNREAARLLGVAPVVAPAPVQSVALAPASVPSTPGTDRDEAADAVRLRELEARLSRVENATQRAEGSAGRADALLVAFAARRAIDRGVPLGYLEGLLVQRFAPSQPQAVAAVITASRTPVRLDQLTAEFAALAPRVTGGGPDESALAGVQRQLRSLVAIRRADQPSTRPGPTFQRAQARLAAGQVSDALAEAMRLPGIGRSPEWVARARIYVTAHRALDEIESSALLTGAR